MHEFAGMRLPDRGVTRGAMGTVLCNGRGGNLTAPPLPVKLEVLGIAAPRRFRFLASVAHANGFRDDDGRGFRLGVHGLIPVLA